MKADELFDLIGEAKGAYVMEAQRHREEKTAAKRRSPARLFLIAAIVAALLTGCAVAYVLSLEDMTMGVEDFSDEYSTQPDIRLVLSLQGVVGSNNYNAAKEWYAFSQGYEQDYKDERLSEEEQMKYYAYNCQTRIQADKVDELCEKYDLQLHGKPYHFQNGEEIYQFLGIPGILKEGVAAENSDISGYFYQEGSFSLEGYFTLTGEDVPIDYPILFNYRCTLKNVFDNISAFMSTSDSYEEWNYTTKDGKTLLLLLVENNRGWIFADRQDAFVAVDVQNYKMDESVILNREQLEAVAERFDTSIRPQEFDEAAMEAEMEAAIAREKAAAEEWKKEHPDPWAKPDYAGFAETYLWNDELNKQWNPDAPLPDTYYVIRDINGDAVEELLIYQDGRIASITTMENGATHQIIMGHNSTAREDGMDLCEDDVLIEWSPDVDTEGFQYCTIFKLNGHRRDYIRFLLQKGDGIWYDCPTMNPISYEAYDTPLTEQQFQEIIDSYPKVPLESLNLRPLKDLAESK